MDVEKIVREFINKTVHMSLGTCVDNTPWVCEVHFAYDENLNLYYRSKKSRRHSQEIDKNSKVAGNIVKQHPLGEYPHAIYFEGTAKELTEESEVKEAYPYFKDKLGSDEAVVEEALTEDGHKMYKIEVAKWYAFGKFGNESGDKYELNWNGGKK